jgi:hypothetical protein
MKQKMDKNVIEFLKDALIDGKVDLNSFKEKEKEFSFEGENKNVWQYFILKSFEADFAHFLPLSYYLLENNLCAVDKNMVNYAVLNGLQIEIGLNSMQGVLDNVNNIMKDFRFDEKLVVTNRPAEQILGLAKKIINNSTNEDFQEALSSVENLKIDTSKSKLLTKDSIKPKLKF